MSDIGVFVQGSGPPTTLVGSERFKTLFQIPLSVTDFGAVGDGVTDDTAAFTAAAAATRFIYVPYSASGYKVANTVVIGSSQCIFAGGFPTTQLVGTATATDVNAIAFNNGQVSARRMRIEPKRNQLTGTNEGGLRGLFISQAEPNTASSDYGDGPWYFNEITTVWTGTRTGSGGVGSSTSATVQGLRVGLDVGGTDYDLMSASAFGSGLIHTNDDTSDGDKLGANSGVYSSATSPGKIYGSSSAVTADTGCESPQVIGHEVDMFINVATGVPKALGYNAWSGGTETATGTYAAYGISRSGDASAVPWDYGFSLYTSAGALPQPIVSTGSLFATDDPDPITLANIFYFPTMVINGDILNFPNVQLSGAGSLNLGASLRRGAPVTKTANFTLADTENWVINNKSGSACVVTLPAASSWTGREVMIKNIQAQTVDSASSDVVPLAGGAAGTAILSGVAGRWCTLVSDGSEWIIMAGVI